LAVKAADRAFRNVVDAKAAVRHREAGWWDDLTLADHIERWAAVRPDADAFVTPTHRLTWRGYRDASDAVAGALIASGLEPGERVAVLLPDGATVHVAFVGAEKAGLTTVGIGARAGDRELVHLLGKTQAAALVTLEQHRGVDMRAQFTALQVDAPMLRHHVIVPRFEAEPGVPVLVDGTQMELGREERAVAIAARRMGPDDLFLVNSTSGTTGMPKCVTHFQNRWRYVHHQAVEVAGLDPDGANVVLGAVPAPFGFGLWTAHFTPTYLGAPTVVMERFSAELTLELIERERVTMLCCVSTQFIMMLNAAELERRDLSSLQVMFTGGEAVPYERARDFEARTGAAVLQFYGSNESGIVTGTRRADDRDARLRSAGRVLDGTDLRLFDRGIDVTASGRGQPGSRGPSTSAGYLDDDAANADLFTPDGFVLHADVCRVDERGLLHVEGRTSDIIIRGGKNISAAQVEDEVSAHPAVGLAAAVPLADPVFGERVCIYVELLAGHTLDLEELVVFLVERGTSKEIMPEMLVVLDELPRSSGGKVAKGELRKELAARAATH